MLGLVVTAVAIAATTQPGPTYLECKIIQQGSTYDWQIALDEARGIAQYSSTVNNGYGGVQSRPARFMANEIVFLGFHINRTTLAIERHTEDLLGNPIRDFGQRKKVEVTNRAI